MLRSKRSPASRSRIPARVSPRSSASLSLEPLEDRCLLAVDAVSLAHPSLISDTAGGTSQNAVVSADGRFVAYESAAANLVANQIDGNLGTDIFLFDRITGSTILVSRISGVGNEATAGNGISFDPSISEDGRFVTFTTLATNLVTGVTDSNASTDVYVFDRVSQSTALVSRRSALPLTTAAGISRDAVISGDGNFIAFVSEAPNVVAGQMNFNSGSDVFRYNRATGTNILVSRSNAGPTTTGNMPSDSPVINRNGQFIAYTSEADNLLPSGSDLNGVRDVFLFNGTNNLLVSRNDTSPVATADGPSDSPVIDNNGDFVAFRSDATNLFSGLQLDPGSRTDPSDVFVFNRSAQTNSLVSRNRISNAMPANGPSRNPSITGNGNFIAFVSDGNDLFAALSDSNMMSDVFLYDRMNQLNSLVSRRMGSTTTTTNGASDSPAISNDGAFVAYRSQGTDILVGQTDNNNANDIFLFERAVVPQRLVSRSEVAATSAGNGDSAAPALSGDGRYVAFASQSTDLVAGVLDTNGSSDIFLYDRQTGGNTTVTTRVVTLPSGTAGGDSTLPDRPDANGSSTSGDRRFTVFASTATNLVPGQQDINFTSDIFLHDRLTGTTTLVSHAVGLLTQTANGTSTDPVISRDGNFVAFVSTATNLAPGQNDPARLDNRDVFLFNRLDGSITLVSGVNASVNAGNNASFSPVLSNGGEIVAFTSLATNLIGGQVEGNANTDVFSFNRLVGTIALVSGANGSPTTTANGASDSPVISGDASLIAYRSDANNLIPTVTDINSASDVYLLNRATGVRSLVSHRNNSLIIAAGAASDTPRISVDGSSIVFASVANNLVNRQVDTNGVRDIFLFDRLTGTISLVSHTNTSLTTTGNLASDNPSLSVDGNLVAFTSLATNLVSAIDLNNASDVFLFRRQGGAIALVSHAENSLITTANNASTLARVSGNGTSVAFTSLATNLVTGQVDNNNTDDVFVFNTANGLVTLASPSLLGPTFTINGSVAHLDISNDGGLVLFDSNALDAVVNDLNGSQDAFAFRFNRAPLSVSVTPNNVLEGQPIGTPVGTFATADPDDGEIFTYTLVPGPGDLGNALFRILGNRLETATVLNAGATPMPTIRVRSTDLGGAFVDEVLTIIVDDINAPPTDVNVVPNTVPENSPIGTVVGTLVTTDPDPNQTFTYTLVAGIGDTDNPRFTISGNQLLTSEVFDFEAQNMYSIRVRTTDQDGASFEKPLTITITDANEAPTGVALSNNTVRDGSPAGTLVGTLIAIDPDQTDTFLFALVAGMGDTNNSLFQINGNNLEVAMPPRLAQNSTLSVRVRVTDQGGLFAEQVLTIRVLPNTVAATIGSFDPLTGSWFLRDENNPGLPNVGAFPYGGVNWSPLVGDWNGDGFQTVGVVDGTGVSNSSLAIWYLRNSNSSGSPDIVPFPYGLRSWIPVAGDWDGDGVEGIGMFDPATGTWYLRNDPSAGPVNFSPFLYGLPGWIPVVGDWDGDGIDSIGVVDPITSIWYLRNANSPGLPDFVPFAYGAPGWSPVVGDWNGDNVDTVAVVDTFGNWFIRLNNSAGPPEIAPFPFGLGNWRPVSGVYTRPVIISEGLQPLHTSTNGTTAEPGGLTGPAVQGVVTAALTRLDELGLDDDVLSGVEAAQVLVADLPGTLLGLADGAQQRIILDVNAAGHGWFVDATPDEDAEFSSSLGGGTLEASEGSAAQGRMDLLTTVAHELAHLAGREDVDAQLHPHDLLADNLEPGRRRLRVLDSLFTEGL
jgi:hypothetical protein